MSKSINELREALFATLEAVKSGDMDLDRARAVNEVAKTIVDTAKVEVDFLRATGTDTSTFLDPARPPAIEHKTEGLPNGITAITQHLMQG